MLSSLNKETEVAALLNDLSEEKEKESEGKSVDLTDEESQTPDPEIQQRMKESLPEEIRRLIYPADYSKAETTEPPPKRETTVPINAAKAILDHKKQKKKIGARQRRKLREPKEKSAITKGTKEAKETSMTGSGAQIWWKDEAVMWQILTHPELYLCPEGFPSELAPTSHKQTNFNSPFEEEEDDNNKSFTISIGRHLRSGIF